jgi:hypothetical protein
MQKRELADLFSVAIPGRVTALAGISPPELVARLEAIEDLRKIAIVLGLGVGLPPISVDEIIDSMAELALGMWPIWFGDQNFSDCTNDTGSVASERATRTAPRISNSASIPSAGFSFRKADPELFRPSRFSTCCRICACLSLMQLAHILNDQRYLPIGGALGLIGRSCRRLSGFSSFLRS